MLLEQLMMMMMMVRRCESSCQWLLAAALRRDTETLTGLVLFGCDSERSHVRRMSHNSELNTGFFLLI